MRAPDPRAWWRHQRSQWAYALNRALLEVFLRRHAVQRALHKLGERTVLGRLSWLRARWYQRWLWPVRRPRRRARAGLAPLAVFAALEDAGVRYVCLRWAEAWSGNAQEQFAREEDVDILIENADETRLPGVLSHGVSAGSAFDVYGRLPDAGTDFAGLPYYPRALADALLAQAELRDGVRVPPPPLAFAALAYHALYHKGARGGLLGGAAPEHDYRAALAACAARDDGLAGVSLEAVALHAWLSCRGWAPRRDLLAKLIELRPELGALDGIAALPAGASNLVLVVIRSAACADGLEQALTELVRDTFAYDIIERVALDAGGRAQLGREMRGGNWGAGIYPQSGGEPAIVLVCYDYLRDAPAHSRLSRHLAGGQRSARLKERARRMVVRRVPFWRCYNPMHTTDDGAEACEFLALLDGALHRRILEAAARRAARYDVPDVLENLSHGRRARVDVVRYGADIAVRKTFRVGAERYFERELFAHRELAARVPGIAPLLEAGEGWVLVPWIEDVLRDADEKTRRRVISRYGRQVHDFIAALWEAGHTCVDFGPQNIAIGRNGEFHVLDFEFLQAYARRPERLDEAVEVIGVAAAASLDIPVRGRLRTLAFDEVWGPYFGSWDRFHRRYETPAAGGRVTASEEGPA